MKYIRMVDILVNCIFVIIILYLCIFTLSKINRIFPLLWSYFSNSKLYIWFIFETDSNFYHKIYIDSSPLSHLVFWDLLALYNINYCGSAKVYFWFVLFKQIYNKVSQNKLFFYLFSHSLRHNIYISTNHKSVVSNLKSISSSYIAANDKYIS